MQEGIPQGESHEDKAQKFADAAREQAKAGQFNEAIATIDMIWDVHNEVDKANAEVDGKYDDKIAAVEKIRNECEEDVVRQLAYKLHVPISVDRSEEEDQEEN